jgi:phage tail-like protein
MKNRMKNFFRKAKADVLEPAMNYKFDVTISGAVNFARASFKSVSGLKADVEVIDYREGGDPLATRKYAGRVTFEPITLSRGVTSDVDAFTAFSKLGDLLGAVKQSDARLNVTITVRNRDGSVNKTYIVPNAWISSYETSDLDGEGAEVLIETITLQHEGWNEA